MVVATCLRVSLVIKLLLATVRSGVALSAAAAATTASAFAFVPPLPRSHRKAHYCSQTSFPHKARTNVISLAYASSLEGEILRSSTDYPERRFPVLTGLTHKHAEQTNDTTPVGTTAFPDKRDTSDESWQGTTSQDRAEISVDVQPSAKRLATVTDAAGDVARKSLASVGHFCRRAWKKVKASLKQSGTIFRIRLAIATVVGFFLMARQPKILQRVFVGHGLTSMSPTRPGEGFALVSLVPPVVRNWVSQRGFQGLAALGRTVAYAWTLFVGYPRLLDRRAEERARQRHETRIAKQQQARKRLSAHILRLRDELAVIEAEIRSFRREIIRLQILQHKERQQDTHPDSFTLPRTQDHERTTEGAAKSIRKEMPNEDHSDDPASLAMTNLAIQKAIDAEMTHLVELRRDATATLALARQRMAELKAEQTWEDDFELFDHEIEYPSR